jgi:hypothetical protein
LLLLVITYTQVYFGELGIWRSKHTLFGAVRHLCLRVEMRREGVGITRCEVVQSRLFEDFGTCLSRTLFVSDAGERRGNSNSRLAKYVFSVDHLISAAVDS